MTSSSSLRLFIFPSLLEPLGQQLNLLIPHPPSLLQPRFLRLDHLQTLLLLHQLLLQLENLVLQLRPLPRRRLVFVLHLPPLLPHDLQRLLGPQPPPLDHVLLPRRRDRNLIRDPLLPKPRILVVERKDQSAGHAPHEKLARDRLDVGVDASRLLDVGDPLFSLGRDSEGDVVGFGGYLVFDDGSSGGYVDGHVEFGAEGDGHGFGLVDGGFVGEGLEGGAVDLGEEGEGVVGGEEGGGWDVGGVGGGHGLGYGEGFLGCGVCFGVCVVVVVVVGGFGGVVIVGGRFIGVLFRWGWGLFFVGSGHVDGRIQKGCLYRAII
mmetsp:Transcript_30301/g.62319  ORF Transcript_30301/g.62319 Transcript_30301/m.62319 type:complete len:320 (-) Transcript_30301:121-1080(-)